MLRGRKSTSEIRFELITWGAILITGAVLYVIFRATPLEPMILFIPGLILLGSTLYQDIQLGWKAGWFGYSVSVLAVAIGLAGVINGLMGGPALPWLVVAIVIMGSILIAKALYDPNPTMRDEEQ